MLVLAVLLVSGSAWGVTFKIATLAQAGDQWTKLVQQAASAIKTETKGRVKFKIYGGGVMGNDSQVIRKIRIGQLQGAALGTGSLARSYRNLEMYNLPMLFRNYDEVDLIRSHFDGRIQAGLEQAGFVNFGFVEVGFAYVMTQNKIASAADLRQQKMWTPTDDASSQQILEAFGIAPIPLGIADVLLALQANTLNAFASPANVALGLQWYTQVKYLLELPVLYIFAVMVLDAKHFNQLSEGDQQIMRRHLQAAFKQADGFYRQDAANALAALGNQGIEFVRPPPAQTKAWRLMADKTSEHIIARSDMGQDLYRELKAKLHEYRSGQGDQQAEGAATP